VGAVNTSRLMSDARIVSPQTQVERVLVVDQQTSSDASSEPEITLVTMELDASNERSVAGILADYVVSTRGVPGCLNVDLCTSQTVPSRFVVIEKWATPSHQEAHATSSIFENLAISCHGLLATAPRVDVLSSISSHDRR
jgi:quinol monooxygenase YgiN